MSQLHWRGRPLPIAGECWEISCDVGTLQGMACDDGTWHVQMLMRGIDCTSLFVESDSNAAQRALDDLGRLVPTGSFACRGGEA